MRCTRCGKDSLAANGICANCDTGGVTGVSGFQGSDGVTSPGFPQSGAPASAGFPLSEGDTPTFLDPRSFHGFSDSNAATAVGTPPPTASRRIFALGPLTAGQPFGPRYHIIKVLGAGGMGVVYQAWDAELGVAVALKVIRPEVLHDLSSAAEVERRFKRELVLARQVTHKHVVRIHDLGELDGIKYLTMPFVEGENLADLLKRQGKLPVPQVIGIAKQVVSGLAAAHEVGVVHRDLKPENIMIAGDGGALIMDFGISRSVSGTGTATAMGAVMGTLEYMAPEQAQGLPVDQRADMYSFGLVVYDMLLGRQRLARRENPMSEMMSRMQHPPPAARTLDETLSEAFEKILTRCLQPLPEARYATTAELVAALEQLSPDGHQLAVPKPPVASRKTILALAAALIIVLGAFGWWAWQNRGSGSPSVPQEAVSVLVANFQNRANEPLFDGLIEQALGVGIEGASFVTAYPRRDAVRLVSQINSGASLDEGNARLVARREGIKRIVSGSITANGPGYSLAVRILDPAVDKPLMTWDTAASAKDDVLNAVGRLAAKVRSELGDTTANANQIKDAETFTAASLEAAHEYVNAQELQSAGKYDEALAGYTKAVQLDPNLGRAYAGLGAVSTSQGRRDEAIKYYKQALGLIDRMTDREKYRTRGGYYLAIRDSDKARDQYEALVKQFPADSSGLSNLAVGFSQKRDMKRALELGRQASAIYPNHVLRRNNVALFAMYGGDFETAEKQAADVLKLNGNFAKAYLATALSQLGTGRPGEAEATWLRLKSVSSTGRDFAAQGRADLAMYEGRLTDAAALLEEEVAHPPDGRAPSTTSRLMATLAEIRQLQGRNADAVKLAEGALGKADETGAFMAARVLIEAGKPVPALELVAELDKKLDREPHMYASLLRGEADLKRADARSAVENFTAAQKILDTWIGHYGLGRAYLAGSDFTNAQTEFDACVSRKGEATNILLDDIPTYRFMASTRYYMARAQEGQGSPAATAAAKESYKAFLAIKEKGDEQGLVADARRRVAR
jgi:serine/threonine protein kinase/tetratricopeptide (TPR) repeat protein